LLLRLVKDKASPTELTNKGVVAKWFEGEEVEVYKYINDHFRDYSKVPNLKTIEAETKISLSKRKTADEPLQYWIDSLEERFLRNTTVKSVKEIQKAAQKGDMGTMISAARSMTWALTKHDPNTRVAQLKDLAGEVLVDHNIRRTSHNMSGITFGFEYLDEVSDGAQGTDTIALVGRPGVGKSYVLFNMALAGHTAGGKPLVVTLEMAGKQTARRVIALKQHLPARMIKHGRLGSVAEVKLRDGIADLRGAEPFYILQGHLGLTVEDLELYISELQPTALYVDGAYLLRTQTKGLSRWDRVSEAAEYLKMLAINCNLPILATYQFNRKGAGDLGNIAFSDVIGQLASIVMSLEFVREEGRTNDQSRWWVDDHRLLSLLKGREGEQGEIELRYNLHRMIIEQERVTTGQGSSND
jgi:replicative DNA helicase